MSEDWQQRAVAEVQEMAMRFGPHPDPITHKDNLRYYEQGVFTGVCVILDDLETRLFVRNLRSDLKAELINTCKLIARFHPEIVSRRRKLRKQTKAQAKGWVAEFADHLYLKDYLDKRAIRIQAILGDRKKRT